MAIRRVNSKGEAIGTSGSDKVYGDNRPNALVGLGGSDTLWGKGGIDIINGGAGNDKVYGDGGNDILMGGSGRDTLTGGSGYDYFGFDTKPSSSNIDVIEDFSVKNDSIALLAKYFKISTDSKGYIRSSAFWTGAEAHDSSDRIIYDKGTGAVYYDPDGTGAKAAVQFAELDANLKLTYKDFGVL